VPPQPQSANLDGPVSDGTKPRRAAPVAAFLLFLGGLVLPVLTWAFLMPQPLLFAAVGMELIALLLAASHWRRPLARVTILLIVIFGLFFTWAGWYGFPTYPRKVRPTADWMKPLEATWTLETPGKPYSIQAVPDVQKNGQDSLRFETRPGEAWISQRFIRTFRAEVATEEYAPIHSVKWYAFSLQLPANFPAVPVRDSEDQWMCLAQWKFSEFFNGAKRKAGSRPGLHFSYLKGRFEIEVLHANPDAREGADEERVFKEKHFPLGKWNDFVVQAKWSNNQDGFVNIWWNGKQIVEYRGPVGFELATGPEFKFGLYHSDSDQTLVAYFNQVKSGDTPQAVGFDPSTTARR
jgi:Polysaccharide lyase